MFIRFEYLPWVGPDPDLQKGPRKENIVGPNPANRKGPKVSSLPHLEKSEIWDAVLKSYRPSIIVPSQHYRTVPALSYRPSIIVLGLV